MNSLSDILSQKADELFPKEDALPPPTEKVKPVETPKDVSAELKRMIYSVKQELDVMLALLQGEKISLPLANTGELAGTNERVVEGSFNGEKMIGDDGKEYAVPPNYASKSKIVPGDRMKLTITKSGSFVY